jgi:hypothetical protein
MSMILDNRSWRKLDPALRFTVRCGFVEHAI